MKRNIKESHNINTNIEIRKACIGCIFKRTKDDKWEYGLAILEPHNIGVSDVAVIIDLDNTIVKSIWTYELNENSIMMNNHLVI